MIASGGVPGVPTTVWARDDSGYGLTDGDAAYVGLTHRELAAWRAGSVPLGSTPRHMVAFVSSLERALGADEALDADVRLQGSAARLFAGAHKAFPADRAAVLREMRNRSRRVPEPFQVDDAVDRIERMWPSGGPRPHRPYFDLMRKLQIDPVGSDLDVQVCSDTYTNRARALARERGVPEESLKVGAPGYAFLLDDVARTVAWSLRHWADDQSEILNRNVVVKIFGSAGPPNVAATSPVSSHFQHGDWILRKPS